ncbi:hypothetical protein BCV71DRAFT_190679 [Rhizopus microsporus]|uniref:Uncharacterized protein n=1 Tax=Rhizopus microsporus TaxID=58291 RepID=A0A1X0RKN8_RHIZD|nr:hypothetical protein BCV71DRAFT_190679 [Rhizopus microsporus]
MENNNSQGTTSCSSCHAPLPVDSCYRTCQSCRERIAGSHRRRRDESRSRAESAAYISQLCHLRPLVLGRMDKECPHCHALH